MSFEGFVDAHFDVKSRYGDEAMALCIFHQDRSASLQINTESGLYICFSCGAAGGPRGLYEELGIPFPQNIEDDLSGVIAQLEKLDRQPKRDVEVVTPYPEAYLKQFDMWTDYWTTRGLTKQTVKKFRLGYNPMGDYVTIPMRNLNGELLGVCKRYLTLASSPTGDRYKYPKGFQRRENLFASWLVAEDEDATRVALVEGGLDACSVWQAGIPALGIYGSALSRHQVRLLLRLGVETVVLFFDNDSGGRKAYDSCLGIHHNRRKRELVTTYDSRTDLRKYFNVERVQWTLGPFQSVSDEDGVARDPGDLKPVHIKRLLRNTAMVA